MRKSIIISSAIILALVTSFIIIRRTYTMSTQRDMAFQFTNAKQENATITLKFNHILGESIWVYGSGEPKDGQFLPRFCKYEALRVFQWKEFGQYYCGTGAMTYELKSKSTYTMRIPIGMFKKNETIRVGIRAFRKTPQFIIHPPESPMDLGPGGSIDSSEIIWSDPIDITPAPAT